MNDDDIIKEFAQCCAALDSIVISCREQQIKIGKVLSKHLNVSEESFLNVLKKTSLELLNNNNLEY